MKEQLKVAGTAQRGARLQEAVWRASLAQAERSDVIIDLSAAESARLELLLQELGDIVADIGDEDIFAFHISKTTPPRLWVDLLSFVVMARDRKTYRFIKDTRFGRQVILESSDVKVVASRIIDYAAHLIIERQKALSDQGDQAADAVPEADDTPDHQETHMVAPNPERIGFVGVISLLFIGALIGAGALLAYAYHNFQ